MHAGSCLCGGIRYQIQGTIEKIIFCHCSLCRKAQGVAFAANAPIPEANFSFVSGQELLVEYESSPGKKRCFCRVCGSPIFSRADMAPGVLRIRAGTLDAPVSARPHHHIYAESKADWFTITDTLPQYPERETPH